MGHYFLGNPRICKALVTSQQVCNFLTHCIYLFHMVFTMNILNILGRMVNILASYFGNTGFKSRPEVQLS
jgi:hypothetical protein